MLGVTWKYFGHVDGHTVLYRVRKVWTDCSVCGSVGLTTRTSTLYPETQRAVRGHYCESCWTDYRKNHTVKTSVN